MQGHTALVGAANTARFRMTAKRHHINKGLILEPCLVQRLQALEISCVLQFRIQRCLYASYHRHQMRHKGDTHFPAGSGTQALADFRQMPVARRTIGLEALAHFAMQHANLALTASPAGAGFCVCDQARRIHQAGFQERQKTQLNGRGITAWVGHKLRLTDLFTRHLRQAIDGLRHPIRRFMGHAIPLRPGVEIFKAVVCGKVHHPHTGRHELGNHTHGYAVRRGEEHQITFCQHCGIGLGKHQIKVSSQVGIHIGHRHPRL